MSLAQLALVPGLAAVLVRRRDCPLAAAGALVFAFGAAALAVRSGITDVADLLPALATSGAPRSFVVITAG
ncbi:MAG TPA: hypothetical protein VNK43_02525, partial [Gemmatimonadales bacterium]|nr:hypothetical protein [Gemmatimonadales bacterium]